MLRRNAGGEFEFRTVELALRSLAPAPLADDRKAALFARIFSQLGEQDRTARDHVGAALKTRWVLVPAGVGLAAALVASIKAAPAPSGQPDRAGIESSRGHRLRGEALVNGVPNLRVNDGDLVTARSEAWIGLGDDVSIGLEPATSLTAWGGDTAIIELLAGKAVFATSGTQVFIRGDDWTVRLDAGDVATILLTESYLEVQAFEGTVALLVGGSGFVLHPEDGAMRFPFADPDRPLPVTAPEQVPVPGTPPVETHAGTGPARPSRGPADAAVTPAHTPPVAEAPAEAPAAPATEPPATAPGAARVDEQPAGVGTGQGSTATGADSNAAGGTDSAGGGASANGTGTTPDRNGNANGGGSSNATTGGSNANGGGSSSAGGSNGAGRSNAGGNAKAEPPGAAIAAAAGGSANGAGNAKAEPPGASVAAAAGGNANGASGKALPSAEDSDSAPDDDDPAASEPPGNSANSQGRAGTGTAPGLAKKTK